jgi:hypothetical protein
VDVKVSAEGRLFYLGRSGGQVWVVDYTNAPPGLGSARQGASTVILWPAPSTGYVLQSTSTLPAGGNWNPVSGVVTTNGQNRYVLVPGGNSQFYRLMKP